MRLLLYVVVLSLTMGCQPVLQRLLDTPPAPQNLTLTSEMLTAPVMRVDIPSRNARAQLSRVAVNKDVETWMAVDNISLSFRQGVLVASRGLGFDLMGADAQGTLNAFSGQGEEVYRRQMRYLSGDNHSTYLMAGCRMKTIGIEVIDTQRLQRLEETCKARQNDFTNIFWLNETGDIVQFKQWLSPETGYIKGSIAQN